MIHNCQCLATSSSCRSTLGICGALSFCAIAMCRGLWMDAKCALVGRIREESKNQCEDIHVSSSQTYCSNNMKYHETSNPLERLGTPQWFPAHCFIPLVVDVQWLSFIYPGPIPIPSMFDMLFAEIIITYYYYVYLQQVIKHYVSPENLLLDQIR